jgi:uncharacterized membrane protein
MFDWWDDLDIDKEKLKKNILIGIIIFFSIIGLFLVFPFLLYLIIFLGILIPSYILYKNKNKKEKDE